MRKGVVSVVLPVYNVEKYLNRCVESVVKQSYANLEILLIDDASSDRSPQLCEEWASKDSRIRVIHKENEGCGMARNTGIDFATGEYIYFVDSDDYILPDTIEKALDTMINTSAEIVIFGFSSFSSSGQCLASYTPCTSKPMYSGNEVISYLLPNLIGYDLETGTHTNLTMSACMMLFSLELIRKNNWRFVSERIIPSEDIYSLLDLFGSVSSVAILPEALYCYCDNSASISRANQIDRYEKAKIFYREALALCHRKSYPTAIEKQLRVPFLNATSAALKQLVCSNIPLKDRRLLAHGIMSDQLFLDILTSLDLTRETRMRKLLFSSILHRHFDFSFCLFGLKILLDKKRKTT